MERYTPTEWKNRIVDDDGTVVQPGTPLSAENLNKLEQMVAFLANALGMTDGIATLNANGVVPSEQLPSNLREMRVVANIAARNALEKFESLRVLVTDATADATVKSGWAEYVYDGSKFVKVGEGESLDIVLSWDAITDKPTDFNPTVHKHTEADITDLDKYTKQEVDDKLGTKAPNQLASASQNGLMSATDYTNLVEAVKNIATALSHIGNTENPHGVTKAQVGLGSVQNYAVASQTQAEAGTSNSLYMTPLRVKQSIAKTVPATLSGFTNDIAAPASEAPAIYVRPLMEAPVSPPLKALWVVT